MITVVIIAPSPLVQLAMFAGGTSTRWLRIPIVKPEHYLACRMAHIRAMTEERGRG